MKQKIMIGILIIVNLSFLFGQDRFLTMSGNIYRSGTNREDLLFRQEEYVTGNDVNGIIEHQYFDINNGMAAFETVTFLNGQLGRYETAIRDIGFSGLIERDGNRLVLTRTRDNKTRSRRIRERENVIVGPMLPKFVKENLEVLKNDEVVNFHLPYFDFLTLVPLELERVRENEDNELISVEMTLRNALLALFIDPIELLLDPVTGEVKEIHGQTILPEPGYGDPKNLVYAEIYYTHGERL